MKFAELNENTEFEKYEIMDTYLSELLEDMKLVILWLLEQIACICL